MVSVTHYTLPVPPLAVVPSVWQDGQPASLASSTRVPGPRCCRQLQAALSDCTQSSWQGTLAREDQRWGISHTLQQEHAKALTRTGLRMSVREGYAAGFVHAHCCALSECHTEQLARALTHRFAAEIPLRSARWHLKDRFGLRFRRQAVSESEGVLLALYMHTAAGSHCPSLQATKQNPAAGSLGPTEPSCSRGPHTTTARLLLCAGCCCRRCCSSCCCRCKHAAIPTF
jgi:hypothetical protein